MTRIIAMNGIPKDEVRQRSQQVRGGYFVPYLSMTNGEMQVDLLKQQAQMLYQYTGQKRYAEMVAMADNALYGGIHNRRPFVGAISNDLQPMARAITEASRSTRPAGSILIEQSGVSRPKGLASGIHIGEDIVPKDPQYDNCTKYALEKVKNDVPKWKLLLPNLWGKSVIKKWKEAKAYCESRQKIQKLLNEGITLFGHHTLYGFLKTNNNYPQMVGTKSLLQAVGHEDCARVAGATVPTMKLWLDTAIMRKNAENNLGPQNQGWTNPVWAGLPEAGVKAWQNLEVKKRLPGANATAIAAEQIALVKQYGQPNMQSKIGAIDPATWEAIGSIIVAVLAAAPSIINAIKGQQFDAFASARGFGSASFGPQAGDWNYNGIPDDQEQQTGSDNTMLLVAAAAGAFLLLNDK